MVSRGEKNIDSLHSTKRSFCPNQERLRASQLESHLEACSVFWQDDKQEDTPVGVGWLSLKVVE